MASNQKKLKAFIRFDGTGRAVSSSLLLREHKPTVGDWMEVTTYKCCTNPTPPPSCIHPLTYLFAFIGPDGTLEDLQAALDDGIIIPENCGFCKNNCTSTQNPGTPYPYFAGIIESGFKIVEAVGENNCCSTFVSTLNPDDPNSGVFNTNCSLPVQQLEDCYNNLQNYLVEDLFYNYPLWEIGLINDTFFLCKFYEIMQARNVDPLLATEFLYTLLTKGFTAAYLPIPNVDECRFIISSVETYLQYAEAVGV
jgi:hypothetical protein